MFPPLDGLYLRCKGKWQFVISHIGRELISTDLYFDFMHFIVEKKKINKGTLSTRPLLHHTRPLLHTPYTYTISTS